VDQLGSVVRRIVRAWRRRRFQPGEYWEQRYAAGGDSGTGSAGDLAEYKASVLNAFVQEHGVRTVLELGCGDGNQLAHYRFPDYLGLDVSPTAVELCRRRYRDDPTKRFLVYDEAFRLRSDVPTVDLTLSIDVVYHLVDDRILQAHLDDLFRLSHRHVVIYSTNFDRRHAVPHQVDRNVTGIIERTIPAFELAEVIENPHKGERTMSDFFVYRRIGS
jgi:SAM-dependent methyltransferase